MSGFNPFKDSQIDIIFDTGAGRIIKNILNILHCMQYIYTAPVMFDRYYDKYSCLSNNRNYDISIPVQPYRYYDNFCPYLF